MQVLKVSVRGGLAFAMVALAVSCGHNDYVDSTKGVKLPSADDLIDHFYQETGDRLVRAYELDDSQRAPQVETLGLRRFVNRIDGSVDLIEIRPGVREAYGEFTIQVYADQRERDRSIEGKGPDSEGIYWIHVVPERGAREPYWTASKPYAANVLLDWSTRQQRTDSRWERLDRVLSTFGAES